MVSSKKLNIVLDIGKTNVKLTFVDSINNKTIKFFTTKQKNTYRHGIKILNSNENTNYWRKFERFKVLTAIIF